jgi:Putative auto-transporter adhesin, head GIN domain
MRKSGWIIGVIIVLLSSCKAPVCDCFDSAGKPGSQVREVPFFTQIVANDNVNVFITIGNPEKVTIEGGGNLLSNIGANVSDGILTLHNNNICNWLRSYKKSDINVYIIMPQLTTITNSGYGTVQSQGTLNVDSLVLNTNNSPGDIDLAVNSKFINAHMFGTADLTLSGQCQTFLTNYFGGTGFIYNSNLVISNYAYISSNTTGECYVNCSGGTLGVKILGQGNVYYSGSPSVVQYTPGGGSGNLIKE